mgnify:CR=1 FL=1
MTDRLLLLSTCGTSLLTNGAGTDDRAWPTKIANDVDVDAGRLMPIVEERRESLSDVSIAKTYLNEKAQGRRGLIPQRGGAA